MKNSSETKGSRETSYGKAVSREWTRYQGTRQQTHGPKHSKGRSDGTATEKQKVISEKFFGP